MRVVRYIIYWEKSSASVDLLYGMYSTVVKAGIVLENRRYSVLRYPTPSYIRVSPKICVIFSIA
jgi:hypothetical protein